MRTPAFESDHSRDRKGAGPANRLLTGAAQIRRRTETVGSECEVEFTYDNRNRLTIEKRTKTSADPEVVEYNIEYEYDQLGNRTVRTDDVADRVTYYTYDTDMDPNQLAYPTHHNRLLHYEVYDTSDPNAAALLRTVRYTYYDTGQASNITVFDEQQPGDPNGHVWYNDLALHYYTHGPLRLAVWGRWQEDENGPIDGTYEVLKAREFRYDSGRARYLTADIATPYNGSQYWELDGDPIWTDYEGDTPYADSTMSTSTYALTQSNRFFGPAGQKDTSTSDERYRQGDLIGSTMATTDDMGSIGVSPVSYTAFGELLDSNGVPGGATPSGMPRYQYAGEWGYEAGLIKLDGADPNLAPISFQHLGWRWYQPGIGRFVQRDPIGITGGANWYLCAGAAPTVRVDPSGLYYDYDDIDNGDGTTTRFFYDRGCFGLINDYKYKVTFSNGTPGPRPPRTWEQRVGSVSWKTLSGGAMGARRGWRMGSPGGLDSAAGGAFVGCAIGMGLGLGSGIITEVFTE